MYLSNYAVTHLDRPPQGIWIWCNHQHASSASRRILYFKVSCWWSRHFLLRTPEGPWYGNCYNIKPYQTAYLEGNVERFKAFLGLHDFGAVRARGFCMVPHVDGHTDTFTHQPCRDSETGCSRWHYISLQPTPSSDFRWNKTPFANLHFKIPCQLCLLPSILSATDPSSGLWLEVPRSCFPLCMWDIFTLLIKTRLYQHQSSKLYKWVDRTST